MEIILLEKVANLGDLDDKVNIKGGYVCNFLLPQDKATAAAAKNTAAFGTRRTEPEKAAAGKEIAAEARAAQLPELVVILGAHAGDEGKLFGSIGTHDIAKTVSAAGYPLERAKVRLPSGALHNTDELDAVVHLHTDAETTLKLIIAVE